jgi:hypothetical protein
VTLISTAPSLISISWARIYNLDNNRFSFVNACCRAIEANTLAVGNLSISAFNFKATATGTIIAHHHLQENNELSQLKCVRDARGGEYAISSWCWAAVSSGKEKEKNILHSLTSGKAATASGPNL